MAAAYVALPASVAVNVHVPVVNIDTAKPDTVQTSGVVEVSVTVRFEFDVAFTVNGVAENCLSIGSENEMVCIARGFTVADDNEDAVVVAPFVAVVVNEYGVPAVNPVTTQEVCWFAIEHVAPPGEAVTR